MNTFTPRHADAWFERNRTACTPDRDDPVFAAVEATGGLRPNESVHMIGCANGWQLEKMRRRWPDAVYRGVDTSEAAIKDGNERWPDLRLSTHRHPFHSDVIIFAFCLYLFDGAGIADAVQWSTEHVTGGGHIVIDDFEPHHPYLNTYEHDPNLTVRKMTWRNLWLCYPWFRLCYMETRMHAGTRHPDDSVCSVSVIRGGALVPLNPFRTETLDP